MNTIMIWPNKATAVGLKHPAGPVLSKNGSLWPQDSFTARRLTDGSVVSIAPPTNTMLTDRTGPARETSADNETKVLSSAV